MDVLQGENLQQVKVSEMFCNEFKLQELANLKLFEMKSGGIGFAVLNTWLNKKAFRGQL